MEVVQVLIVGQKFNEKKLQKEVDEIWTLASVYPKLPKDIQEQVSIVTAFHEGEEEALKAQGISDSVDIITHDYFDKIYKRKGLPPRLAFNSSLAGLLYYSIMELLPFESYELTFEGFPMAADEEYFHQRESIAYYIGFAESYAIIEGYHLLHEGEKDYGKN